MVFQFPPFFFYQKLLHKHHEQENAFFYFALTHTCTFYISLVINYLTKMDEASISEISLHGIISSVFLSSESRFPLKVNSKEAVNDPNSLPT